MRAREAHIVVGGIYELPTGNHVRVEADLGDGALACRYTRSFDGPLAQLFQAHRHAGEPLHLSERFIAKHGVGPRR